MGVKTTTASCEDDKSVGYTGGVNLPSPAIGTKLYLNGYEIVLTSGDDKKGEGLLFFPYLMKRIPVEWTNKIDIRQGETTEYGCIVGASDKVQVQGSNAGALSDDLNRQFTALAAWLNDPGSFTGTFGAALEKIKTVATQLKNLPTPVTQAQKDAQKALLKELQSAGKAASDGFTDWKSKIQTHYGSPMASVISDRLTEIGKAEALLNETNTCLGNQISSPSIAPQQPKGKGGPSYFDGFIDNCAIDFDKLIATPDDAKVTSDKLKDTEDKKGSVTNCTKKMFTSNGKRSVSWNGINLAFTEDVEVVDNADYGNVVKVLSTNKQYVGVSVKERFGYLYDITFIKTDAKSDPNCGAETKTIIKFYGNCKNSSIDKCPNALYDKSIKILGNWVNDFTTTPLTQAEITGIQSFFSGNHNSYETESTIKPLKLKLFLSDFNTSPADLTAIEAYVTGCNDCIWFHKTSDGAWNIKDIGYGNGPLTPIQKSAYDFAKKMLLYYKESPPDKVFTGIYSMMSKAEKWLGEIQVPEKYWNCDSDDYWLYKWVLDEGIVKNIPLDALKKIYLGAGTTPDPRYTLAYAIGILDGIPAFASGIFTAGKILTGLPSTTAWGNATDMYEHLKDYDNGQGRVGMSGALMDGLSSQFSSEKPCVTAHNLGVLTTGVAISVFTAGYGAFPAAGSWLQKGMWVLKKLDDLSDIFFVSGKVLKGFKIASTKSIRLVIGDAGKVIFRDADGAINLSNWSKKLTQNVPNEGEFDVFLPNGEVLPANAELKGIVKDKDGNWLRDENGNGIGCVLNAGFGYNEFQKGNFLEKEPVLYASLGTTPSFGLKSPSFTTQAEGCPDGTSPVVVKRVLKSKTELEALYESIKDQPFDATPGSDIHKAQRWAQYKESGGDWEFERWSNTYESNMTKAIAAHAKVKKYFDDIKFTCPAGETCREVTQNVVVNGEQRVRRLDIANKDAIPPHGIEVKAYETGKVYATKDILREIEADAVLVQQGWKIEWKFIDCKLSQPLRDALTQAGIKIL